MRKQRSRIRHWNTRRPSQAGVLFGDNRAGTQMNPNFLLHCPLTPNRSPPARYGEVRLATRPAVIWTELGNLSPTNRVLPALETRREMLVAKVLVSHQFVNSLSVSHGCGDGVGSGL